MTFDSLFENLRRGPWGDDPNGIPQEGAIGGGNIEPSGWLADDSVSASVIQANAVTASKITAGAITADKIAAGAIEASKIAAGSITADKIASNAVTSDKIAANSVTASKIAANSITASEIAAGAVSASEIAADAITASKIATNAVTADAIAANSVTANEIAANAVTTSKILAGNVTSSRIEVTVSGKRFGANFGSVGAPGIFFDSNSDTGIYATSSTITIAEGGAPRIHVRSGAIDLWGSPQPGIQPQNIGGAGASRWGTVFCNTVNQTSDKRLKSAIADSPLGLDFVRLLRPRSFRWKSTEDTQAREATLLDEEGLNAEVAPWVERIEEQRRSEDPSEAVIEEARAAISEIKRKYARPVEEAHAKLRAGRRDHYGLIAQEVKAALDAAGVDAAFWKQDEASGEQSLDYIELLAPLIKAVQELAARVEELEVG